LLLLKRSSIAALVNDHETFVPKWCRRRIDCRIWNNLKPQFQQILQEAADESVEYQRKLWQQAQEQDMKTMIDSGTKVSKPDKELFRKSVKSVWDDFANTEIGTLIQGIQEVNSVAKN
jgi:TRAP-type C4-dicarboxylate transport system substrate-binding protein